MIKAKSNGQRLRVMRAVFPGAVSNGEARPRRSQSLRSGSRRDTVVFRTRTSGDPVQLRCLFGRDWIRSAPSAFLERPLTEVSANDRRTISEVQPNIHRTSTEHALNMHRTCTEHVMDDPALRS